VSFGNHIGINPAFRKLGLNPSVTPTLAHALLWGGVGWGGGGVGCAMVPRGQAPRQPQSPAPGTRWPGEEVNEWTGRTDGTSPSPVHLHHLLPLPPPSTLHPLTDPA